MSGKRVRRPGLVPVLALFALGLTAASWWFATAAVDAGVARHQASLIDGELARIEAAVERVGLDVNAALDALDALLREAEARPLVQSLSAGEIPAIGAGRRLGDRVGLDLLTLFDESQRVVASKHWPQRAGLSEPSLDRVSAGRSGLWRVELADGGRLAVVARRSLELAGRRFSVVGGQRLVSALRVDPPAGGGCLLIDPSEEPTRAALRVGEFPGSIDEWVVWGRGSTTDPPIAGDRWSAGRRELLDANGQLRAVAVVALPQTLLADLRARLGIAFAAISVVGLVLAGALGSYFVSRVMHPADRLVAAVDAIAAGQADYTFPQDPGDGLDRLPQAFSRLQRSLEEQQRRSAAAERVAAWREVARRVAHEVKNPLTPIRLTVENLVRARRQAPERFEAMFDEGARTILEEVGRLRKLVGEFSEFARLPRPEPRPVELHAMLDAAVELYSSEPGLEVLRDFAGTEPVVEVDPDQFGRVLHNVLGNAVEAMRSETASSGPAVHRLELRTAVVDSRVEIEICDSGPGFPEDTAKRIFEPYFTTKTDGTGLGLAMAYRIVTEHDGFIDAENGPGGGARIVIRLPLAAAPAPTREESA